MRNLQIRCESFKGTRIDGTVFDSSYNRGEPADFSLQGVVPGFSEGFNQSRRRWENYCLFIPSDLAYGENPRPGGVIQPGDTLIFECELIKINLNTVVLIQLMGDELKTVKIGLLGFGVVGQCVGKILSKIARH